VRPPLPSRGVSLTGETPSQTAQNPPLSHHAGGLERSDRAPSRDPYDAFTGPEHLPVDGAEWRQDLPAARAEPVPPEAGSEHCDACAAPDEEYVWVSERWRVRSTQRPTGLPVTLGLETRAHLDLGDLPNLLAAEFGVMTVRLERAVRSLPGIAQVHVQRWGDGESHLRVWFLARPTGQLQLRGPYLPVWDRALPPTDEDEWRDRLGTLGAWLAGFGGRAVAPPPRIEWRSLPGLAGGTGL
jgi:hypothetical protein